MVPRGLRVGLLRVWGHCSAWSGVIGGVALVAITLIHSADTRHVLKEKRERARTLARASEGEFLIQEKIMPIRSSRAKLSEWAAPAPFQGAFSRRQSAGIPVLLPGKNPQTLA